MAEFKSGYHRLMWTTPFDRPGWHRITPEGLEYLGTERPDDRSAVRVADDLQAVYYDSELPVFTPPGREMVLHRVA